MSSTSDVELELAKLKGQISGGTAPQAIPAAGSTADATPAVPVERDEA
jgi:hypothetical protein